MSRKLFRHIFRKIPFKTKKEKKSYVPAYGRELKELLGFEPRDYTWYDKAFTHPSSNKKDETGMIYNYDRLEFLGDSVLSLVVSEIIFKKFKRATEGELSELRAKIVSRKNLNEIGKKMRLRRFFGKRPRHLLGENLEGNALEAIIGAVYMDAGYQKAKEFIIKRIVNPYVNLEKLKNQISSYKNALIEWAQKHHKHIKFTYHTEFNKHRHRKIYFVSLYIDNRLMGRGRSSSRKRAEEIASKNAYRRIKNK